MPRYAYIYFMTDDPSRVRSVASRHAEYWHSLKLEDYTGGPFTDRSGGLITFRAEELHDAEDFVANDPFVREGLIERSWLQQWDPKG
jgi:uncharacterized protein YciI